MIEIQMVIVNEFGEFAGKKAIVTEEDYSQILVMAKDFYKSQGFEITCENGDFIVFPPEIVKKSMLKIIRKDV